MIFDRHINFLVLSLPLFMLSTILPVLLVHGSVEFYALNAFSGNNDRSITMETCAYASNSTNSRLCVTTPIFNFGIASNVLFQTPCTSLYNLTATVHYTAQSNVTLATVHIDTYNITSYNFFLVLYTNGFTESSDGSYEPIAGLAGYTGPPAETNTITLMTLNLFYPNKSSETALATIPAYHIYTLDGTNVYNTANMEISLPFQQTSTVEYTPSLLNGDGYYMYDTPFEVGWAFPDGTTITSGGEEANCYRGQLFANIGIGYETPSGAAKASFSLLTPPLVASPPTFLPTAAPSFTHKPTVYPTQAPSTIAPTDHSKTSSLGNLSSADIAGVSIGIVCGVIILVALIYFAFGKYYGNNKKDTEKTDLVGNERL